MKQGGHQDTAKSGGFTIVETMIVLAVSALLFGSAVLLINGKQQKAEFQTSIFSLKQRMQQIVNQSESGYYPTNNDIACNGNANGAAIAPMTLRTVSGTSQGSNGTCVFLGNTIRFGGYDAASYTVYPMAGNRLGAYGQIATTYTEAWPTAIARGTSSPYNPTGPQADATEQLEGGLKLAWGSPDGGITKILPASNSFAVALLGSLSSGLNNGTGGLNSGSQQFSLYGFGNPWTNPGDSTAVVDAIDRAHGNYISLQSGVLLCFSSGSTDQSGLISITNGLAVALQVKNGPVCA